MDNIIFAFIVALGTGAFVLFSNKAANKLGEGNEVSNPIAKSAPILTVSQNEVLMWAKHWNGVASFKTNVNPQLVLAMVEAESAFKVRAERTEKHVDNPLSKFNGFDKSLGLMQVLTSTAQDMFDKGYKRVDEPTIDSLFDTKINIYFGMAYIDWLQARMKRNTGTIKQNKIIEYYNGGYGNSNNQTRAHLARVNKILQRNL